MNRRTLISLFVVFTLLLSLHAGSLSASAEDYIPELLPAPAADGHLIDGDALKLFFDNYLHENYCDGEDQCLSIAVWCPDTDEYWYYNPDVWMYGVNWYRLPVSMYLAEKVSKGELTMDTVVNGITLEYAINTALAATSNPSSSSMVIYLGGNMTTNCADLTKGLSNMPDSYFVDEYYQENAYTARLMLEITKTLYLGGEERFPLVEESMKEAMPEESTQPLQESPPSSASKSPFRIFLIGFLILFLIVVAVAVILIVREQRQRKRRRRRRSSRRRDY